MSNAAYSQAKDGNPEALFIVVSLMPDDSTRKKKSLAFCAKAFFLRFFNTNSQADISSAIAAYDDAMRLTCSTNHDEYLRLALLCGTVLLIKFEAFENPDDIHRAILLFRTIVDCVSRSRSRHLHLQAMNSLATSLIAADKCPGAIKESIDVELPSHLFCLEESLRLRHARTQEPAHLSEPISIFEAVTRIADPTTHTRRLISTLYVMQAKAQVNRYYQTNNIIHISDAISSIKRGIAHNPDDENFLKLLSIFLDLWIRHDIDATDDISEAISLLERVNPENSSFRDILSTLCALYARRLYLLENLEVEDLSKAISAMVNLIQLTPANHKDFSEFLEALAVMYNIRYHITKNVEDLSLFIATRRNHIEMRLPGDEPYVKSLCILAISQWEYYVCTQELQDLEVVITSLRTVQSLYAVDETDEAWFLLFIALWDRSRKIRESGNGNLNELTKAIEEAQEVVVKAINQGNLSPSDLLNALEAWSLLARTHNDPSEVFEAGDLSIRLLSQVAAPSLPIQTRLSKVSQRGGNLSRVRRLVPRDITIPPGIHNYSWTTRRAWLALRYNRPDLALEWLEQGRCFVWNQIKQLRTPVEELRAQDSVLADRFLKLSESLEAAGFRNEQSLSPPLSTLSQISQDDDATGLDLRWIQLLKDIRKIPKFQKFLCPPASSDILMNLPLLGPVIIINVAPHPDFSCTALALLPGNDEPIRIDLPDFSFTIAEKMRSQLTSYLASRNLVRAHESGDRATRVSNGLPLIPNFMYAILERLWVLVVKPILDALAYSVSCVSVED